MDYVSRTSHLLYLTHLNREEVIRVQVDFCSTEEVEGYLWRPVISLKITDKLILRGPLLNGPDDGNQVVVNLEEKVAFLLTLCL